MSGTKSESSMTFPFSFRLKEPLSSKAKKALEAVNIVQPKQALSGYITKVGSSSDRLEVNLPLLGQSFRFSTSEDIQVLSQKINFYNLCCSLQACIFVHSVDGNDLLVTVLYIGNSNHENPIGMGKFLSSQYKEFAKR